MEEILELPGAEADSGTSCDLLAHAAVRADPATARLLRLKPGPGVGERLSPAFLKHADEQSVAGLAAVLQAIDRHGLGATRFTRWGVLGAPRFLGRVSLAAAMHRFAAEGAWGISPHLIPHHSLHALSGTISQALKIHGPNYGVGGGPRGAAEALLTAVGLLAGGALPGLWVVFTGWDPEPVPDREGRTATPAVCQALALALAPAGSGGDGLRLHLDLHPGREEGERDSLPLTLENLAVALTTEPCPTPATWSLPGWGRIRLERARAGVPAPHLFRRRHLLHAPSGGSGAGPGREA